MSKQLIIKALFFNVMLIGTLVLGETVTLVDNFDGNLDNWDKPKNRFMSIVDGVLTNRSGYASNISFKEKNMESFTLTFKLKLLKKIKSGTGHVAIEIDRGDMDLKLYLTTYKDKVDINSKFFKKDSPKKPVKRKRISINLDKEKWINVKIVCNKEKYELSLDDKNFLLGKAPGKGGFSIGSYRQPFAIDDFKIVFEKIKRENIK